MKTLDTIKPIHPNIRIICDERDPDAGNASHEYEVFVYDGDGPPTAKLKISFQHGPVAERGRNGIVDEALLAILIDRAEGFQSSRWPSLANDQALIKLREALQWKQQRTLDRLARGVEGTNQK